MKLNIQKYIMFLLLFLLVVFFARGPFYEESTSFSRGVISIFVIISGLYIFKVLLLKNKLSRYYLYCSLLLCINIVGLIFTGDFGNGLHSSMFINTIIAIIPFYPFYYFARRGLLRQKHLILLLLFLMPVFIAKYYYNELLLLLARSFQDSNITNNIGYYFSSLVPFLFFVRKRRVFAYIMTLVLSFFIISSAKRGAMLVGGVGIILFVYYQLRSAKKKEFIFAMILSLIGVSVLLYYGYEYIQSNEYLLSRFEATTEGDSSGRDVIYKNVFTSWSKADSPINIVLGFGYAASLKLSKTGHFAHNDWLELLSNFGLLGIFIYALLILSLVHFVRSSFISNENRSILITICIMWLLTSIFSMVYTADNTAIQSVLVSYLIGSEEFEFYKRQSLEFEKNIIL